MLVVEDTPDDAELMILALKEGGLDPTWERVQTAEELAAALAKTSWDAVFSDYTIPEFGAAAALEIVRAADLDLPFLIVSGTVGEEVAAEMMRVGANDFVLKQNLARLAPAVDREMRAAQTRRKSHREVQAAARLAAIVDSSDDAIYSETVEGVVTSWNAASERLYGWKAGEVIGRHICFTIPPDKTSQFAAVMEQLGRGAHFQQFETVRLHRDGTRRDVSITISPIRDQDGRIIGISKVARDITTRKLENQNRQVLQSIIESSPSFIVVANLDLRAVFLNRAGQAMVGLDNPEAVSRTAIPDYFFNAEWERIASEVTPVIREGGHQIGEGNFRHFKTGEAISADWIAFTIPNPDTGRPAFFACVANDNRERKRREVELRSSEDAARHAQQRLQHVLASSPTVLFTLALADNRIRGISWISENVEEMLGYRPEHTFGPNWWLENIHPEDRERGSLRNPGENFWSGTGDARIPLSAPGWVVPVDP